MLRALGFGASGDSRRRLTSYTRASNSVFLSDARRSRELQRNAGKRSDERRLTRPLKLTWPSVAALLRVHAA